MAERQLALNFVDGELIEVCFMHSLLPDTRRSVRGKSAGAYRRSGSFQWTSAVKGLALLFLKEVADRMRGFATPPLAGGRGSFAASLDYAIAKEPEWIVDVFGTDSRGTPVLRRLVQITNSNQKRPGPVAVSLNQNFLPVSAVKVSVAGVEEKSCEAIESLIRQIIGSVDERAANHTLPPTISALVQGNTTWAGGSVEVPNQSDP